MDAYTDVRCDFSLIETLLAETYRLLLILWSQLLLHAISLLLHLSLPLVHAWIDGIGMKNVFTMLGVSMTVILLSVFTFIFYVRKFRVRGAKRYRHYAGKQFECRVVVWSGKLLV